MVKSEGQTFDINIEQVYAPTNDAVEEEIKHFYTELGIAAAQCKKHELTIVMGESSAK